MLCSCCGKQKADLHPKKSKLLPTMMLYLCNDCIKAKREPRFLIILTARAKGTAAVADYIKNRRYVGDKIAADEVVS